jgi:serine/threonine protein kinase
MKNSTEFPAKKNQILCSTDGVGYRASAFQEYHLPRVPPSSLPNSLKPENVLLDSQGYIKLTDFGLSMLKISGNDGATSLCGTLEYIAPEVIQKKSHGKPFDWWTLGVIIYEMSTGEPPFINTCGEQDLFYKIQHRQPALMHLLSPNLRYLKPNNIEIYLKDCSRNLPRVV